MKVSVLTTLALSLPLVASSPYDNRLRSRQSVSCGVAGYDNGSPEAYFYSTSSSVSSAERCGARCAKQSKCKSYAFGKGTCLLYTSNFSGNFKEYSGSPYRFYDKACAPASPVSSARSSKSTRAASNKSTKSVRSARATNSNSSPQPSNPSNPGGNPSTPDGATCGKTGYDKNAPEAYYSSSKKANSGLTGCRALCESKTRCASFAFGGNTCLLYDQGSGNNFDEQSGSKFTFYDLICFTVPTLSPSSSEVVVAPSSSAAPIESSSVPADVPSSSLTPSAELISSVASSTNAAPESSSAPVTVVSASDSAVLSSATSSPISGSPSDSSAIQTSSPASASGTQSLSASGVISATASDSAALSSSARFSGSVVSGISVASGESVSSGVVTFSAASGSSVPVVSVTSGATLAWSGSASQTTPAGSISVGGSSAASVSGSLGASATSSSGVQTGSASGSAVSSSLPVVASSSTVAHSQSDVVPSSSLAISATSSHASSSLVPSTSASASPLPIITLTYANGSFDAVGVQIGTNATSGLPILTFSPSGNGEASISVQLPSDIPTLAADGTQLTYKLDSYILIVELSRKRSEYLCSFQTLVNGIIVSNINLADIGINTPFFFSTSSFILSGTSITIITQQLICLPGSPAPVLQAPPPALVPALPSSQTPSSSARPSSSTPTSASSAAPSLTSVIESSTLSTLIPSPSVLASSSALPSIDTVSSLSAIPSSGFSTVVAASSIESASQTISVDILPSVSSFPAFSSSVWVSSAAPSSIYPAESSSVAASPIVSLETPSSIYSAASSAAPLPSGTPMPSTCPTVRYQVPQGWSCYSPSVDIRGTIIGTANTANPSGCALECLKIGCGLFYVNDRDNKCTLLAHDYSYRGVGSSYDVVYAVGCFTLEDPCADALASASVVAPSSIPATTSAAVSSASASASAIPGSCPVAILSPPSGWACPNPASEASGTILGTYDTSDATICAMKCKQRNGCTLFYIHRDNHNCVLLANNYSYRPTSGGAFAIYSPQCFRYEDSCATAPSPTGPASSTCATWEQTLFNYYCGRTVTYANGDLLTTINTNSESVCAAKCAELGCKMFTTQVDAQSCQLYGAQYSYLPNENQNFRIWTPDCFSLTGSCAASSSAQPTPAPTTSASPSSSKAPTTTSASAPAAYTPPPCGGYLAHKTTGLCGTVASGIMPYTYLETLNSNSPELCYQRCKNVPDCGWFSTSTVTSECKMYTGIQGYTPNTGDGTIKMWWPDCFYTTAACAAPIPLPAD